MPTMDPRVLQTLVETDPEFVQLAQALYGNALDTEDLIHKLDDRQKRGLTAGLSAVGAAAGAYGLGIGAHDIVSRGRKAGAKGARNIVRTGFKAQPKHMKVLTPLELAGLTGEISATHILHGDTKKPKGQLVSKANYVAGARRAAKNPKVEDLAEGAYRANTAMLPDRFRSTGKKIGNAMGVVQSHPKEAAALGGTAYVSNRMGRKKGQREGFQAAYAKNDMPDLELAGTFSKFDDDKRQAFGFASVVKKNGLPVVDRQGDFVTPEDMEKAAYHYVQKSRKGGDMHRRTTDEFGKDAPHHVSDLIESMVFTPEKCKAMGLPDEVAKSLEGHWWVGYQVHDEETWQEVRKKGRTGFSIHGRGKRQETTLDDVMAS